jgi:hypothetical protein
MEQVTPLVGSMIQNEDILQPSMDDYIRAADEMSSYLTWDMNQLPPWINFNDPMPLP